MYITINFLILLAIVILSLIGGFWIGRSVRWMMIETEERINDEREPEIGGEQEEKDSRESDTGERQNRKIKNGVKRIPLGWSIGSPVGGTVRNINDSTGRGALIQPEQGKLYAPASGKIIRLYPMGNAMLLRTDFGVELLLRVGEMRDELHSMYYRSCVIQNEIVSKGKLLLEFDLERLCGEGVNTAVSVTVDAAAPCQDITLTRKELVKAGEELLWVRKCE